MAAFRARQRSSRVAENVSSIERALKAALPWSIMRKTCNEATNPSPVVLVTENQVAVCSHQSSRRFAASLDTFFSPRPSHDFPPPSLSRLQTGIAHDSVDHSFSANYPAQADPTRDRHDVVAVNQLRVSSQNKTRFGVASWAIPTSGMFPNLLAHQFWCMEPQSC